MNRYAAGAAVLAAAVAGPSVAAAHKGHRHSSHRAVTMKASIAPVTVDAAYAGIAGKAQLVDNKRRDKVSIHMRGLKPGTTYPWHVHVRADGVTNPCAEGAAQGPIVTAFKYGPLRARRSGNANADGRSKTFKVDKTKRYYVNVHSPTTGEPIACGVLRTKSTHHHAAKKPSRRKGHR
jgi:hypothetical protein